MTPQTSKQLLAYTPMMHARMFGETTKFRDNHFQPMRGSLSTVPTPELIANSKPHLDGNPAIDRPLFVQFCANDPDEFIKAASFVAPYCDAVDLNLGCPQGIARKGKYGAFLQEDQDLIYNLINKLHLNLPVPITAKIRILGTPEQTLHYARKVLDAGASILTVHGRQRDQKGHKTGLADWTVIRYLRDSLPEDTVIFANGNILRRSDIDACLEATGADAVMSAEGNLYDPAIFSEPPEVGHEGREYWRGKDGKGGYRVDGVLRRYMDIMYKYVLEVSIPERIPLFIPSDISVECDAKSMNKHPKRSLEEETGEEPLNKKRKGGKQEKTTNPNLIAMQPHLFHLLRPLVKKHHHIRDALAKCRAGDISAFENVLQMTEKAVKEALIEYESTNGKSVEEDFEDDNRIGDKHERATLDESQAMDSSVQTVRDCRRPWWIAQPYVRPTPTEALQKGSLALSKKELAQMSNQQRNMIKVRNETKVVLEEAPVDMGHTEKQALNVGDTGVPEKVEIAKDGLVCC